MRHLAENSALAIVTVSSVLVLIIAHEMLAAIGGHSDRFVVTRRWLARVFFVLTAILALLIIARFYYLRT